MNLIKKVVACGLLATSCSVYAGPGDIEASGNVMFTTDYLFRGISQTDEKFAIQGGLDLAYGLSDSVSAYVGTWASNVDFNDTEIIGGDLSNVVDDPSAELDVYGGFSGSMMGIEWDLGGLGYIYPGAKDLNYAEVYGTLSHQLADLPLEPSISIGLNYSPDNFASTGDAFYGQTNIDLSLPLDLTLSLHGARQWIENNDGATRDGNTFGTPDYWDWSVAVSREFWGFDLSVGYYDTDISASDCFGGSDLCQARVVASISRSL